MLGTGAEDLAFAPAQNLEHQSSVYQDRENRSEQGAGLKRLGAACLDTDRAGYCEKRQADHEGQVKSECLAAEHGLARLWIEVWD
jgi:hypothetical protein